jgi:pimeloyl-ACP methyl ester carboxylesterase
MAPVTPRSGKQTRQQASRNPRHHATAPNASPEAVDPIWLLKAFCVVLLAALLCGYLTFCLLFYQGQWQLVLHPDRSKPAPATIGGAAFETVHFGVNESGTPQLTGWWIPSGSNGLYVSETLLYLPGGDGSLAHDEPRLAALHSLGINIFAFDYRGYGQSAAEHPSERRMNEDAASAWQYLTVSRQTPGAKVIPFGEGVGAAIAAQLAATQTQISGVILDSPRTDLLKIVHDDPRTRLLPARAMFHETFDIAAAVANLKTAKLFLLSESAQSLDMERSAAEPKMIVALPASQADGPAYLEQISRFLDQLHPNQSTRPGSGPPLQQK